MKCWKIWRLLLSNFRYHHASGSDVCCGASGQVLASMRLEVWSSCYCWWLRLREGLHWEVGGWHPKKKTESRQDSQVWKYMRGTVKQKHITQSNKCYLNFKIAKKHATKQSGFVRYHIFFESCYMLFPLSSRGGLEKGDKSIRSSPLQPQASIFCSVQDLDFQVWMISSRYFLSFVDGSRGHPEMWLIYHGGFEVEDTDTVESQDAGLPLPSTTLMPLLALQRAHSSVHRADSILHGHLVVSLWWSWLDHLWVEAIEAYLAHRPELRRGFSKTLSDLQFLLEFHLIHLFADPGTIHNQLLSLGLVKYFRF